jgi:AraC family transcriptional regulator
VKIAPEFGHPAKQALHAGAGRPLHERLGRGDGWCVSDVTCMAGPRDRPFEEQHSNVCIAVVTEGSFQYRSSAGRELMTPGSLLLGNAGQHFECGHEHGIGDRCISFSYDHQYFENLASETGVQSRGADFSLLRLPPVRELSSLVARACAALASRPVRTSIDRGLNSSHDLIGWEEISIELAMRTLAIASGGAPRRGSMPAREARVTRIVRMIESRPDAEHGLGELAREAKLSRYHFLRIFRQITGLTPHRYILRTRLRRAATRLIVEPTRVLDIALDSGFGDVSNFNHAFHAEFGASPRSYRKLARHSGV